MRLAFGVLILTLGGALPLHASALQPSLCTPDSPLTPHLLKAFCQIANDLREPISLSAGKDETIYRLTAIPSFKPAFVVRLTGKIGRGGAIEVRAWKKGERTVHLTSVLTAAQFERVQNSVREADFWQLPTIADRSENPDDRQQNSQEGMVAICGDGIGWVIEAVERQSYHISYSGCMPYKRFDDLASSFVTLAQHKFPQLSLDWDK